jgi:Ca2+-binding EF-hand superfamily protein
MRCWRQGIDLLESFEFFDEDRSGTIDEYEFRGGLRKLGVTLARDQVAQVMDKFKGRRQGEGGDWFCGYARQDPWS